MDDRRGSWPPNGLEALLRPPMGIEEEEEREEAVEETERFDLEVGKGRPYPIEPYLGAPPPFSAAMDEMDEAEGQPPKGMDVLPKEDSEETDSL
jgi:hypothetical protein